MRSDWGDSSVAMIDTNVLVYAHDTTTPEKQEIAIALIERLARERRMAISFNPGAMLEGVAIVNPFTESGV